MTSVLQVETCSMLFSFVRDDDAAKVNILCTLSCAQVWIALTAQRPSRLQCANNTTTRESTAQMRWLPRFDWCTRNDGVDKQAPLGTEMLVCCCWRHRCVFHVRLRERLRMYLYMNECVHRAAKREANVALSRSVSWFHRRVLIAPGASRFLWEIVGYVVTSCGGVCWLSRRLNVGIILIGWTMREGCARVSRSSCVLLRCCVIIILLLL